MSEATTAWRVYGLVPFHALVFVLLAAAAPTGVRTVLQGLGALLALAVGIGAARSPARARHTATTWIITATTLQTIADAGAFPSPLLPILAPVLLAAAVTFDRRHEKATFAVVVGSALALMILADRLGVVPATPATPPSPFGVPSSGAFVGLAALATAYGVASILGMGELFARAHERVADELAARREELCTEGEDWTLALEGIAARLSHEVKNPLAAIKGLSTHMARNSLDPQIAERLSIVAGEADRLQGIVDGFLSFSRGFDDLRVAPVRPHDIARELALLLEVRAAETGLTLAVSGNADVVVNADGRKLRQALLNLVLNAMQASPPSGAVVLDVGRGEGGSARIKIIDHGTGMTPEVLDRLRKPYFTTKEGGSGLGVAVARGLVEQHGGKLSYESAPQRGTTALVELPSTALALPAATALPDPSRPKLPDQFMRIGD